MYLFISTETILRCISSVLEAFLFFCSTCHTEPSSLLFNNQLCSFGVFAVIKDMEIQTLAFLSCTKSSVEKVFLLSLRGKLIIQRCLNFDCRGRKPVFNKDCI